MGFFSFFKKKNVEVNKAEELEDSNKEGQEVSSVSESTSTESNNTEIVLENKETQDQVENKEANADTASQDLGSEETKSHEVENKDVHTEHTEVIQEKESQISPDFISENLDDHILESTKEHLEHLEEAKHNISTEDTKVEDISKEDNNLDTETVDNNLDNNDLAKEENLVEPTDSVIEESTSDACESNDSTVEIESSEAVRESLDDEEKDIDNKDIASSDIEDDSHVDILDRVAKELGLDLDLDNVNEDTVSKEDQETIDKDISSEDKSEDNTLDAKQDIDESTDTESKSLSNDEISDETPIEESKDSETLVESAEKESDTQESSDTQVEASSESTESDDHSEKQEVSFFDRLRKTRENLAYGVSSLIKGRKIDEDLYEELETALLTADLGVETCDKVIERLRTESKLRALHDADLLKDNLHNILSDLLKPCEIPLNIEDKKPFVILMVGVNGAGKTTTIGKLAQKFKAQGKKVMLAAGDTFRAAAVEQLKEWGRRIDVPVVSQATGSDAASVIFDALESARSKNMDVLICDTAGRLQNKDNLMEELRKIVRVMKKIDESVPNEVLLVLDAATGQNAVSQTKLFKEAVDVTGIALTKLDGTAKGGVIFALADKFNIPIRYVGIGERAEDLHEFKVDPFVRALIEENKN